MSYVSYVAAYQGKRIFDGNRTEGALVTTRLLMVSKYKTT
jgi:hypothetical protein